MIMPTNRPLPEGMHPVAPRSGIEQISHRRGQKRVNKMFRREDTHPKAPAPIPQRESESASGESSYRSVNRDVARENSAAVESTSEDGFSSRYAIAIM